MKLEQSIIITRPVACVFAYRSTLENAPTWQHDVLTCTLATPGPTRVGTVYTELRQGPHGTTQEWRLEVTEFEQDHLLGIVGHCGTASSAEQHLVVSDDGATRYTLSLEMTGSAVPASAAHRRMVNGLLNLKWILEAPRERAPRPAGQR